MLSGILFFFFFALVMFMIKRHCNIRGAGPERSGRVFTLLCLPSRETLEETLSGTHRHALQRNEQDTDTTEEYVSFLTHRGTRKPAAQRGQRAHTACALV